MNQQIALIADIIQSRKSENRFDIQKRLIDIIDFLNKAYKNSLVKKVEISSGDSFQGLFDSPGSAFLYIRMVQMLLYPIKIRAGIGVGGLDYMDKSFGTNLLDGEAYHNAKEAIDYISSTRKELVAFQMKNINQVLVNSINTMLVMYYKLRQIYGVSSLRISLVNELLNPMSQKGNVHYLTNIDEKERELLEYILNYSFVHQTNYKNAKSNNYSLSNCEEIEPFILCEINQNFEQYINSSNFVLRGIQDNIGNIIGTSRQNVQKYFSKGVGDERMYATTLIFFLNEVIK